MSTPSARRVRAPLVSIVIALVGLAATAPASPARAQAPAPAAPTSVSAPAGGRPATTPPITPADLRTRLFLIADDSMQGREPGGKGNWQAAEYVAAEFRRLGLAPAGEQGTYFQTVPFLRVAPAADSRLEAGGTTLALGRDFLISRLHGTAVALDRTPSVYAGPANDSTRWIAEDAAAGKLLVFDIAPGPDGLRSRRTVGPALLSGRFARAVGLVVAGYDLIGPESRAASIAGRLTIDTAGLRSARTIVWVTPEGAATILGAPVGSAAPGAAGRPVSGRLALQVSRPAYAARNVVAVLRGHDPALRGEYVALTAHNDHVGFDHAPVDHDSLRAYDRVVRPMGADSPPRPATPEEQRRIGVLLDSLRRLRPARPDSIRNGADDDGTGTVSILEIAERLAAAKGAAAPRRSILFVSHTGEEYGLVGSAWFTDHPTVPRDSIVAEIDQDMVGRGGAADLPEGGPAYLEVVGARRLSREYGDLLEAANAGQPQPFRFNYAYDAPGHPLQYYCRADHYNYARYSIPAVAFSRGEHLDYHQVTDEPQYIDYEALARVSAFVFDAAMRVANLDHRPALDAPKGDPHAECRQ